MRRQYEREKSRIDAGTTKVYATLPRTRIDTFTRASHTQVRNIAYGERATLDHVPGNPQRAPVAQTANSEHQDLDHQKSEQRRANPVLML
jgi:hypothetical protein